MLSLAGLRVIIINKQASNAPYNLLTADGITCDANCDGHRINFI